MELIEVDYEKSLKIIHPESRIVHKYLDGTSRGVEIGAASYAPFAVPGTINVSTGDKDDRETYKGIQLAVCGSYLTVDIEAEADEIPLEDNSQDYVIASHVLEHCSNPIACLLEWKRIVKPGGYIVIIVPKREAPYGDSHRYITPLADFRAAYEQNWTNEQAHEWMRDRPTKEFDRMRGHVWVFNLESLLELIRWCNGTIDIAWMHFDLFYSLNWKLLEAHETDDTDGTGHLVVLQQGEKYG